jgi:aminoglycoside phosphotransferase (APT) family kinase protein
MLEQETLAKVETHLAAVFAATDVRIAGCRRFHGGASRETYAIDVVADGIEQGLILRCDPADSLIDTARALEFAAYRSFESSIVPVPRAISLVEDATLIGTPFFIMERIEGGEAAGPMDEMAYGDHRESIGKQFFGHLGHIHAVDAIASPLAAVVDIPSRSACWSRELDYWDGVIAKDAFEPEPIAAAAIRWLRRNPPSPAQTLAIVHGDYRNGNVLHDKEGKIVAVLDWEMAHIGDPLEDLAWALDPLWNLRDETRAAGLIPREDAIAIWEKASGCRFDSAAFQWWEMFATLKGLAIWVSSARAYASGTNADPILAFSGWYPKIEANRILSARLAPRASS